MTSLTLSHTDLSIGIKFFVLSLSVSLSDKIIYNLHFVCEKMSAALQKQLKLKRRFFLKLEKLTAADRLLERSLVSVLILLT